MAKRRKKKIGLQKTVSSVFEGVSIPQRDNDEKSPPKPAQDGLCGDTSKSRPRDSLVSKSSVMKKVCRSKSSSVKTAKKTTKKVLSKSKNSSSEATKKTAKKVPSKRKTSIHPALQDSPAQELHRPEVKPDKTTPDRTFDFSSKLKGLDHLIPHLSPAKKSSKTMVSSDRAAPDYSTGVPPKLTAPDIPIPPCVFVEEPPQADNVSDNAEPDRTAEAPSKETAPSDLILQPAQVEEPLQTKDSPEELTPDRIVSIPSWMMSPEGVDPQSSPINKSTPSEESSNQVGSDLMGDVSEAARDESQDSSEEEPPQTEDAPEKVATSKKSRVPLKLTTPDHPIPRNKTESDHTDASDSRTLPAVETPASQTSLVKKLHQTENAPRSSAPDRTAEAPPISKPAEPQAPQQSESRKRYEPETPHKEAVPSAQPETMVLEETKGPSLWQQINNKLFAPKTGVSPTRQKVMVISIPILAIVMIFIFRQVLSKSPQKTKGAPAEDVAMAIKADPGHEIDWQIPEPLPATMRDPTELSVESTPQPEEPIQPIQTPKTKIVHLGTIVYSNDKPSAIVNGRIVYTGEEVSGVTILRINRDSVEFEKDGERWVQKIRD